MMFKRSPDDSAQRISRSTNAANDSKIEARNYLRVVRRYHDAWGAPDKVSA
jgi:hypothetical protein